jgi:hypothetical protein
VGAMIAVAAPALAWAASAAGDDLGAMPW